MTLFDSIQHSQSLLRQLSSHQQVTDHTELKSIVDALNAELEVITSQANKLIKSSELQQPVQNVVPHIDENSGCYQFENKQGFFCPNCYDQTSSRVATKRLNRKLRVCPVCRASIKPRP
ncbi:MAG: hypothetical protein COB23_02285 [Methylophaga sp.]|nr:MAG: hypothetical protein COB23_02285 [Methylophaga sp.]